MKKDVAIYKNGVIVDFKGVEHPFIVCALSTSSFNEDPDYDVSLTVYDKDLNDYCNEAGLPRAVFIGVSVCNPGDEWNEEKGKMIAKAKAGGFKFNKPYKSAALFATRAGLISTELVEALLTREVAHIQEDPESVIPGYNQMKAKYEQKLKEEEYVKDTPDNLVQIGKELSKLSASDIERVIGVAIIESNAGQ